MSLSVPDSTTRNRSASTGDSGLPEHEHKRPRLSQTQGLSTGDLPAQQIRGVHSQQAGASTNQPKSQHDEHAIDAPPKSTPPSSVDPPVVASPTSKVTINTRPLSSQSFSDAAGPTNVSMNEEVSVHSSGAPPPAEDTDHDSRVYGQSTAPSRDTYPDAISISSSDSESPPPIEVSAPEDYDQDPADTKWEIVDQSPAQATSVSGADYVHRTFPGANQFPIGSAHIALSNLTVPFSFGSSRDDMVFKQVKTWLVDLVTTASRLERVTVDGEVEFWINFPKMVTNLLRRDIELSSGVEVREVLEYLTAFIRLTAMIARVEATRFLTYPENVDGKLVRPPITLNYIQLCRWILSTENIPAYQVFFKTHNISPLQIVQVIVEELLRSGALELLQSICELFDAFSPLLSRKAALVEHIMPLMDHAAFVIDAIGTQVNRADIESRGQTEDLKRVSLQVLLSADQALERAIVKQHAWLTIENCDNMLTHFETLIKALVSSFPQSSSDIVAASGVDPTIFSVEELVELPWWAWKFTTLRKFIRHGRMELRVFGIRTMADDDLIRVYRDFIHQPTFRPNHPVVRFMVRFIQDNQLIRYLIGVDSHPQIINRSSNVVGFLCVSQTYQNEDTDAIWQAFLSSQDPRAGNEILTVLQNNFEHLDVGALHYIVQKVLDLPFDRVDVSVLEFTLSLMRSTSQTSQKIRTKGTNVQAAQEVASLSMRLCLHFLQESHTPQLCTNELAARVRQFLPDHLKQRLDAQLPDLSPIVPPEDLDAMFKELCVELEAHTSRSNGSAIAIQHVLQYLDPQRSVALAKEYNTVKLIVTDLALFSQSATTDRLSWFEFESRISTLFPLVSRVPEDFTADLIDSMWQHMLSSAQQQPEIRSRSWLTLANIMERCPTKNGVFDSLIQNYAPRLTPADYDESFLRFSQEAVRYQCRTASRGPQEVEDAVRIPGIERIWDIMLEAQPNTVETPASDFIIREHLDSDLIVGSPLAAVDATHLALIERCVQQVIDAAAYFKTTPAPEDTRHDDSRDSVLSLELNEIKFHRSLLFLRKFLEAIKSRPRFTETRRLDLAQALKSFPIKGSPLGLNLQIHNHSALGPQIQKWTVGLDNMASDLWQFISRLTGWPDFTMIWQGARVVFKDNKNTLRDLKFTPGIVLVNRIPGTMETLPDRTARASSPVDNKVMHHFDELYSLLELENRLAKAVYDFLTLFSSHDASLQKLRSKVIPADELLPVAKPYKLMYYAKALRSCIEDESFSASPDTDFVTYAVDTIITTLGHFDQLQADSILRLIISHNLCDALVLAFRAKVSEEVSKSYLENHERFGEYLLALWSQAQSVDRELAGLPSLHTLVRIPFMAIIESVLHNEAVWDGLPADKFSQLLARALLYHPMYEVRQATLEVINGLTGLGTVKSSSKVNDPRAPRARFPISKIEECLSRLWAVVSRMIPIACNSTATCQEFFEAASSIFKMHGKKLEEAEFASNTQEWMSMLLDHRYKEEVGSPLKDLVPKSLSKLLIECFRLKPKLGQQYSKASYGKDLFTTFLFPPLSDDVQIDEEARSVILDMPTRQAVYDLVLAVSTTNAGLNAIASELSADLVPKDYYFQPNIASDRQCIRSEVGYAGLRNLANTCYLNSLFTQLFMNVEFRDFLLKINIVDEGKQKLIAELAKVFAYMQNTLEDAVSPDLAVSAITQWDGEQIDVAVQMDVDEFFNLLFDRIEFQILDLDARNRFKSIYGGQLVQQIKSKECEHVSERLEPFSAVQVEIKGKAGLEDSLRAYVEGEVLQGENKYSCTGCGKHVDAVKRACLKEVPDHLIFNLKRFDYDIMTGMRCKVNDEFSFPDSIDMSPYMLDALSNPDTAIKADMFELVGIIVHSGSAESGHYYSFIRDRPSGNPIEKSWIQFNDQDVASFNPVTIRDCCFGGIDFETNQCSKFYNAYMLFYQRSSSIETLGETFIRQDLSRPVRVELPADLEHHITQQNELYLRSYVAQDPIHARFVKSLLQLLPVNNNEQCLADHAMEMKVSYMVLDYVDQLSARWKDHPEVEDSLKTLELHATRCGKCAYIIVQWFLREGRFGNNVIRSCYAAVRRIFVHLIITCWQALAGRQKDGQLILPSQNSAEPEVLNYDSLLISFCKIIAADWDLLQRHGRAWDQYFGILSAIVKLGTEEAQAIIDEGLLERSMELVHLYVPSQITSKRLKAKYHTYLVGRERNRIFGHGSLVQFLADVLPCVALDAPLEDDDARTQVGDKFGLLHEEAVLLGLGARSPQLQWLDRLIVAGHNMTAIDDITACLAKTRKLNPALGHLLKHGLRETVILTAVAYLQPTLAFLTHAVDEPSIVDLVEASLESIETTGGKYGSDFLSFVSALIKLENDGIPFEAGALTGFVYDQMKSWAPVLLMHPNDIHTDVRGDTVEFINDVLFTPLTNFRASGNQTEYNNMVMRILKLIDACADYAQNTFLDPPSKEQYMELQAGQANQVLSIVKAAIPLATNNAEDEEKMARVSAIMEELRLKSEDGIDTVGTSDWREGSSDLEVSSDVELSELSQ